MATPNQNHQSLMNYMHPSPTDVPEGIPIPTLEGGNFDVHPQYISMLQRTQYDGTSDPHNHIKKFKQLCSTIPTKANVTPDHVRFKMFGFTLGGKALDWYDRLPGTITTWDQLCKAFLIKFYPPKKTMEYRFNINHFTQEAGETLYEAWERFNELLRACPHHGFEKWFLIQIFYSALDHQNRSVLDSAAPGGIFMEQNIDACWDSLEKLAVNSHQWNNVREARKVGNKGDSEQYSLLANQLHNLTKKIEQMNVSRSAPKMSMNAIGSSSMGICDICGIEGHDTMDCQLNDMGDQQEQVNAFQAQPRQQYNPFSNTYNPGFRDHPNLSYRSNNVQNPMPQPQQRPQQMPPGFQRPQNFQPYRQQYQAQPQQYLQQPPPQQ